MAMEAAGIEMATSHGDILIHTDRAREHCWRTVADVKGGGQGIGLAGDYRMLALVRLLDKPRAPCPLSG